MTAVDPAFRPVAETLARVATAAAWHPEAIPSGADGAHLVWDVDVRGGQRPAERRQRRGGDQQGRHAPLPLRRLAERRARLRPGSSHLSSIDFKPERAVDAAAVTAYVREAVSRHEELKARAARPKPGA